MVRCLAILSACGVKKKRLFSSIPHTKWFQELCVQCGVATGSGREEVGDDDVADAIDESIELTSSHIVVLDAGKTCVGPLTPWSQEELTLWHWMGFPADAFSVEIVAVVQLNTAVPLTTKLRNRLSLYIQNVPLQRPLASLEARLLEEDAFQDCIPCLHRFVDPSACHTFSATPLTLLLPDVLHKLVLQRQWRSWMLQASHVALGRHRQGGVTKMVDIMQFPSARWIAEKASTLAEQATTYPNIAQQPLLRSADLFQIAKFIRDQSQQHIVAFQNGVNEQNLPDEECDERQAQLQLSLRMENWVSMLDAQYFQQEAPQGHHGQPHLYPVQDLVESLAASMKLRDRAQLQSVILKGLKASRVGSMHSDIAQSYMARLPP